MKFTETDISSTATLATKIPAQTGSNKGSIPVSKVAELVQSELLNAITRPAPSSGDIPALGTRASAEYTFADLEIINVNGEGPAFRIQDYTYRFVSTGAPTAAREINVTIPATLEDFAAATAAEINAWTGGGSDPMVTAVADGAKLILTAKAEGAEGNDIEWVILATGVPFTGGITGLYTIDAEAPGRILIVGPYDRDPEYDIYIAQTDLTWSKVVTEESLASITRTIEQGSPIAQFYAISILAGYITSAGTLRFTVGSDRFSDIVVDIDVEIGDSMGVWMGKFAEECQLASADNVIFSDESAMVIYPADAVDTAYAFALEELNGAFIDYPFVNNVFADPVISRGKYGLAASYIGQLCRVSIDVDTYDWYIAEQVNPTVWKAIIGSTSILSADVINTNNINVNGSISFVNTVWDDIRIQPSAFDFTGANDPTNVVVSINGTPFRLWEFAQGDVGYATIQMPHGYKRGTTLRPHIHWTPGARGNEEIGNTVNWRVSISHAQYGEAFSAFTNVDLPSTVPAGCLDWQHIIGSSVDYPVPPTFGESGILLIAVSRITGDTWSGSTTGNLPLLLEVDIHHQIDKVGSNDEIPS